MRRKPPRNACCWLPLIVEIRRPIPNVVIR